MKNILILLILSVLFSCSNKNETSLSERMELLNGSMEHSNAIMIKENEELFNKLNSNDKINLDTINELSNTIIKYMNDLKRELVENSGGYDEYGKLVNTNDYLISFHFIKNSKYGEHFKETLDAQALLITEMGIFEAPSLVLDGKSDPYWSKFPNPKAKSALELLFANSNLTSCLATISILQIKILEYERKVYQQFLVEELESMRIR